MTRRHLLTLLSALGFAARQAAAQSEPAAPRIVRQAHDDRSPSTGSVEPLKLDDAQWKARLTPAQYAVLRHEGTERPFTSPLNAEKRKGRYHCAGCELALFTSEMKYDSGTGWPSFYSTLPGVFQSTTDFKLLYPRTEYHCARCGGHHGHVFNDGPAPTGKRYCNNGVALTFIPVAT